MNNMLEIQKVRYAYAPTHGPSSFIQGNGGWREDGNATSADYLEVGTADGDAESVSLVFGIKDADVQVTARHVSMGAWDEFVRFVASCDSKIREHRPEEGDVNPFDEDQAG